MSIMSKLKIENNGMLLVSVFYIIAGIISLVVLPLALYPPHFAIIGIFSLVTAYGLFKKRSWALYPVIILFLTATVLSIYTLYFLFMEDIMVNISMIAYLILTWVATAYTVARRTKLES
jgi:hypothetical protein